MGKVRFGKYEVEVGRDEWATSPRHDNDNVSTMYCSHRRYRLGDEDTSLACVARELLNEMEYSSRVEYLNKFFEITSESEADDNGYIWVEHFIDGESFVTISEADDVYEDIVEDLDYLLGFNKLVELVSGLVPVFRLLYLYDHSGISISGSPFTGRAPHASWDSGIVGFAIITQKKLDEEGLSVERGERVIDVEIEEYDKYLRGDVYYINVSEVETCDCCNHEHVELIDSCFGFYAHEDMALGMADSFCWEDIDEIDVVEKIKEAIAC